LLHCLNPLPNLAPALIEKLCQVCQPVCLSKLEPVRHHSRCPGFRALPQALKRIDHTTRHHHAKKGGPKEKYRESNPHRLAQQQQLARGNLAIRQWCI
jgi:hypothetical protein